MDSPPIMPSPPSDSSCLTPPALPERSSLRASRLLDPMAFKNALDVEQPPLSPVSAPHDVYLSSEEDASSSADDFSDYEFGSESDISLGTPDLMTQQDTARIISVIYHGKPSLVNLSPRSTSPTTSANQQAPSRPQTPAPVAARAISRSSTVSDMEYRRSSVASTASSTFFNFSRSSTMTLGSTSSKKPAFLSIDPFASKSGNRESEEMDRPRTPTAMLKRKLTLTRKRSKQLLNDFVDQSLEGSSPRAMYHVHGETQARQEPQPQLAPSQPPQPSTPRTGVSYQDIMKAARGAAAAMPPPPPIPEPEVRAGTKGARSRLRNLSISRRLNVKA